MGKFGEVTVGRIGCFKSDTIFPPSIRPLILLKLVYGFFRQIFLSAVKIKIKINGQRQIIFYFSNHKKWMSESNKKNK